MVTISKCGDKSAKGVYEFLKEPFFTKSVSWLIQLLTFILDFSYMLKNYHILVNPHSGIAYRLALCTSCFVV